ncbi:hypothetical protein N7455_011589 [Penicillium solitum]|uniref:uncharacterized protein n=1 Tax=Penicillium solitum TaxID=60172 RepID=UPI0032C4A680|nr:hypothetical protein N7455_011589 [Penicillium solitum]
MDESIPLRILVTSRDTVGLDQSFSAIPPSLVQSLPMSTKDTESDIRLLIDKRTQVLRVVGPDDRGVLLVDNLGARGTLALPQQKGNPPDSGKRTERHGATIRADFRPYVAGGSRKGTSEDHSHMDESHTEWDPMRTGSLYEPQTACCRL